MEKPCSKLFRGGISLCNSFLTPISIVHHVRGEKVRMKSLSRVQLFATPWTVAYQAFPSMGFSRQEYWSGLPFPSPENLLDPRIKPSSPALEADVLPCEPSGKPLVFGGPRQMLLSQ